MEQWREKEEEGACTLARLLVSNCDEERPTRCGVARKRARELAHLRAC